MQRNIILAGVGGQGILSIAYVVDNAALDSGLHFKQAEVHGMAQRGGAVQSHLRLSDGTIHSDLVPEGAADLILSVEPVEALRYANYLAPEGWTVTSLSPYVNIPDYPVLDDVFGHLVELKNLTVVDAARLAKEAGTPRAQNMVMLGAAAPQVGLGEEPLKKYIAQLFGRKGEAVVAKNVAAFDAGRAVGAFFRALVTAGTPAVSALKLVRVMSGKDIDERSASLWKDALTGQHADALRKALDELDDKTFVTADKDTAERAMQTGTLG